MSKKQATSDEWTRQGAARLERAGLQVNGHAALREQAQKSPDFAGNPGLIAVQGMVALTGSARHAPAGCHPESSSCRQAPDIFRPALCAKWCCTRR